MAQKADEVLERLTVITWIHRNNKDPQYFHLEHSDVLSAKFMKLKILKNWGYDYNMFYSFDVVGLRCD